MAKIACAILVIVAMFPIEDTAVRDRAVVDLPVEPAVAAVDSARELYQLAADQIARSEPRSARVLLESLVECHPDSRLVEVAVVHLIECQIADDDPQAALQSLATWAARLESSEELAEKYPDVSERISQLRLRATFEAARQAEKSVRFLEAMELLIHGSALQRDVPSGLKGQSVDWEREWLRVGLLGCQQAMRTGQSPDGFLSEVSQPRRNLIRFALAEALQRDQKYSSALEQYETLATDLASQDELPRWAASVDLRRCELNVQLKKYPHAENMISAARERYPEFESAYRFDLLLARCDIARIEFDQAKHRLSIILQDPRADDAAKAQAQWTIGEICFLERHYPEAIEAYREVQVFESRVWKLRALTQQAKCEELLGMPEAAIRSYQKIVEAFPDLADSGAATERIAILGNYVNSVPYQKKNKIR